jgi:integrase/recombinase XerD
MTKKPLPAPLRRAADTFDDYLRVERGASPRTISAYRRDLRRYLDSVARSGATDVRAIKPKHVTDAMQRRSRTGAAPTTLNRWLAAVRHFHKFCVREGIAPTNPAALVDGPARGLALPKALGEDETRAIVEAAAGSTPPELRDRVILELLYGAGLRVSELVGLDIDDVDLDDRTVRCLGKGEKERIVPIGGPAVSAVRRYLREARGTFTSAKRPSHALLISARGSRLSRQSAWTCVKRYAARVYPDRRVYPHILRHSYATHLMARGADVRVVQEALGHARLSTTQVYTLVTRQKLKDVYESAHPRARTRKRDAASRPDAE